MYRELLQYIAMTGPLNFRHVATDKWNIFKELASKATQGTSSGSINTASQETVCDIEALRSLDSLLETTKVQRYIGLEGTCSSNIQ